MFRIPCLWLITSDYFPAAWHGILSRLIKGTWNSMYNVSATYFNIGEAFVGYFARNIRMCQKSKRSCIGFNEMP
jgi:hypothetical protein